MSESCEMVKGVKFLAKVPITQNFLRRLECIPICAIQERIEKAHNELMKYCDILSSSSSSISSSSSSCCPIMHTTPEEVVSMYLINIEDLDQEVYDLLELLEAEACEATTKIRELELLIQNEGCWNSSSSSSLSSSTSDSSSSDCCVGPDTVYFSGVEISGVFTNENITPFTPEFADTCNFYTKPSEVEGVGVYMYFYDTDLEKWVLHRYIFEFPFESTLIGEETTGNNKCEFYGIIAIDEETIEVIADGSSSSSLSSISSSSSSGVPDCASFNLLLNSNCPDLVIYDQIELAPFVNSNPGYGSCGWQVIQTSSSSSSSSGTFNNITVVYNIGGFWEIQTSDEGTIAIFITDNNLDPRGDYQYTNIECIGSEISVAEN